MATPNLIIIINYYFYALGSIAILGYAGGHNLFLSNNVLSF